MVVRQREIRWAPSLISLCLSSQRAHMHHWNYRKMSQLLLLLLPLHAGTQKITINSQRLKTFGRFSKGKIARRLVNTGQGEGFSGLVYHSVLSKRRFYHFAPFNFEETIEREHLDCLSLNVRKSTAAPTVLTALIAAVSALNTLQESWRCWKKSREIA